MQRPGELVLRSLSASWRRREGGVKASESSGKLLHFGKIQKKFGQNLAKLWKFCKIYVKNQQKSQQIVTIEIEIRDLFVLNLQQTNDIEQQNQENGNVVS